MPEPRKRGRPPSSRFDAYGEIPREPGFYIYEIWAGEVCLYVGRVGDNGPRSVRYRLSSHAGDKPWWPEVTRISVTSLASHEEIAAEEPRRIRELAPRHNRTYARFCRKGHDQDAPGVRYQSATGAHCAECQRERSRRPEVRARANEALRKYNSQPEVRERLRERDRSPVRLAQQRRAALARSRRPASGQEGLW